MGHKHEFVTSYFTQKLSWLDQRALFRFRNRLRTDSSDCLHYQRRQIDVTNEVLACADEFPLGPLPTLGPRVIGSFIASLPDPLPARPEPLARWREAAASRRRGSSPSSSSSGPSSPSHSSSPSSSSAGTWRGGWCLCTCRWCRRSPGCAGRNPPSPSRPTAAASPGSTSPRLRPPKGFSTKITSAHLNLCSSVLAWLRLGCFWL